MRILFTLSLLFFLLPLHAQEKGVSPIQSADLVPNLLRDGSEQSAVTRAVIVGISDYRDDRIPDLNFAHKDAEAFKAYLRSPAGGELPEENLQLLTNEKATTGQIVAAMGWLVEESQPEDKVIIYFSGHGDVERISKFQRGYLLTHDSPPNNYMAGAFPVFGLQDIISTLSEMDVQVVMVSDACRAGKLAGSNVNGTQATSAVLAQQFANEIKILSCQPEEFSLEGEQWGGGRGCFSYHLLDGLYGLADKNTDEKINLLEIERYLEDKVMTEAAPHSQIPMTVGSKSALIANVDKKYLEKLLADKKNKQSTFAGIESKGIEDLILENADTNIQELYQDFLAAIENGNLMKPEGKSANDYYEILIKEKSIEKLHGFMRRNFAAALMDGSQKYINIMLQSGQGLTDFYETDSAYQHFKMFPSYLNKAAELLGENHYMYNRIKGNEYFMQSKQLFFSNDTLKNKDVYRKKITLLEKAKKLIPNASYVYFQMGMIYSYVHKIEMAIENYEKSIESAPTHLDSYGYLAENYIEKEKFINAIFNAEKALSIDSTYANAHYLVAVSSLSLLFPKKYKKQTELSYKKDREQIHKFQERVPLDLLNLLGHSAWMYGKFEEALDYYKQIEKRKYTDYRMMGSLHLALGNFDEAIRYMEIGLQFDSISLAAVDIYMVMSASYFYLDNHIEAEKYIKKAIEISTVSSILDINLFLLTIQLKEYAGFGHRVIDSLNSASPFSKFNYAKHLILFENNYEAAYQLIEQGLAIDQNDPLLLYLKSYCLAAKEKHNAAIAMLEKALKYDKSIYYFLTQEEIWKEYYQNDDFLSIIDQYKDLFLNNKFLQKH